MIRTIQFFLFGSFLLYSVLGTSQDTNTVELHLQMYDEGICLPMLTSIYYSTSRYRETKQVLQSGSYYSTIYAYVNSPDSADLQPKSNHKLQSSSLHFNPKLDYELVILRSEGFNRTTADSMVINISKLDSDAQLVLPFKKGKFKLKKMKFFKKLKSNASPDFRSAEIKAIKNTLKLDSTTYFTNGKKKANYYVVTENFPLHFVQEFDSIKSSSYSQGFHLLSNAQGLEFPINQPVWTNTQGTKYGYWEYFEYGKRVKHELLASILQEQYEWYPSGQLKSVTHFGQPNQEVKHVLYLENGAVKEEFYMKSQTRSAAIKSYAYSSQGKVILINTYNSSNGITKQDLQKRELFYPSGQLKMEENLTGTYNIKYYNEDGTEKIN